MGASEHAAADAGLSIHLFGPFEARLDGQPLPRLRSRKVEWLLALLTLRHGREVSRDYLAGTLWPDSPEAPALANLRQSLTNLRHALGAEAGRLVSPTVRAVLFDLAGAAADVIAFDSAVARGDTSSLEVAVSLRRGPLLEGCEEAWIWPEREAREHEYLTALETLAAGAGEQGDHAAAVRYLRLVIASDPLREAAHRHLMQALAAGGNHAAATLAYRDLRLLLHREMNAEPDPETAALFQDLRASARQRTRTLTVAVPRAAGTAPPPRRLPQPLSRLIGRDQEVVEIAGCLDSVRLVTLTGVGGVGKTRLAIAVTEEVADLYPDGAFFVDLAPLFDPALVCQALAEALGVREEADRSLLETLRDHLQRRFVLVVLDNCEHLLEACASVTADLLVNCGRLRFLATSRQSLGLTGELAWPVPPLPVPDVNRLRSDEKDYASVLLTYGAVRLFADRARLVRPAFRLTAHNAGVVARICQQLEGIPLALELAAARVKALSAEQIADRLDHVFDLLTGGSRTALPRHQTLRATLDWSYNLLIEAEQAVLRRLSVFAGGWTLDGAEAVGAGDGVARRDVLDLLSNLVNKSLVLAEPGGDSVRYRLLEPVRQYARELWGEAEQADIHRRHADFFLALAGEARSHLWGAASASWCDRLEAEYDNVRAAFRWLQENQLEDALRLANALWRFWYYRGGFHEGRKWLEEALSSNATAPLVLRSEAFCAAAFLAIWTTDRRAGPLAEEGLALARAANDPKSIAGALSVLGIATIEQGDAAVAAAVLEEGLPLSREVGDPWALTLALLCVGLLAFGKQDYERAATAFAECLERGRKVGDNLIIPWPHYYLAALALLRNDTATALAQAEDGLVFALESRSHDAIAHAYELLGRVLRAQGDVSSARALFTKSLTMVYEKRMTLCVAHNLEAFAGIALADAQPVRAVCLLAASEKVLSALELCLLPVEHVFYDGSLAAARAALSKDAFAAAWAAGDAMTLDQAAEYALQTDPGDETPRESLPETTRVETHV